MLSLGLALISHIAFFTIIFAIVLLLCEWGQTKCVRTNTIEKWTKYGRLHRTDGPAVIYKDGSVVWYKDGQIHRIGGPAVMRPGGYTAWVIDGLVHREDGPAVVWANGLEEWFQHDRQHRIDGPAVIHPDGSTEWWINGCRVEALTVLLLGHTYNTQNNQ